MTIEIDEQSDRLVKKITEYLAHGGLGNPEHRDHFAVRDLLMECRDALSEPDCNPHPRAPHGFDRNGSHNAGRYVCTCEGWDPWQDGYDEGFREGLNYWDNKE
jgi:hypothetical protein